MPVWLEYSYRDTVMHRMHPLAKISILGLPLLLTGLYWDPRYLAVIGVFGIVFTRLGRVPRNWFKPVVGILIALLPYDIIGVLTQANSALFKVLPQSFVSMTLFTVNLGGGIYGVTAGGLVYGLSYDMKIAIVLTYVYTFVYSTSFSDIIDMLSQVKAPQQLILLVMLAYRLIPQMWRQLQGIMTASRLRGWSLKTRSPRVLAGRVMPLLTSMMNQSLVVVEQVSLATRIRAFGVTKMTPIKYTSTSAKDKAVVLVCVVTLVVALYMLFVHNFGNI